MSRRRLVVAVALVCAALVSVHAQTRRLGPKDRLSILDARVDPTFASTPLKHVLLLPFGNELDYQEGSLLLSEQFVGEMHQKHPEVVIEGPQQTMALIQSQRLAEDYRVFAGNYINTGVATVAFLQKIGRSAQVDGILMGQVLAYGVARERQQLNTGLGVITLNRTRAVVGMEVRLLRASDGRELWWGMHAIEGRKDENVREISRTVGEVFATFFGRLPY